MAFMTAASKSSFLVAWALTIHKAQGQSFDEVVVDLGVRTAFAAGQVYVALSRCKSLEGLFLMRDICEADIKIDRRVREFYDKL